MMDGGIQRFLRDVGWSFGSLAISALVHLILRVFLARYLGADDLGLYTLSFAVYSVGLTLAGFGIGAALIKYAAQFRNDSSKLCSLLSSGCAASILLGGILGGILYMLSPTIAERLFHIPEMTNLLHIVAFAFPFIALQKASLGFLNGLRRMRVFAMINVAQNIFVIILTIMLVAIGYGVPGAMIALVVPIALTSVISLYPIRGYISKPDFRQHGALIKALMVFGLYVVMANVISTTQGQIDIVMLGYFMTETEVGHYATALIVAMGMRLPSSAIQMVTGPTIASYWGNGDVQSIERLMNRVMKLTAVLMLPIVFVLAFFASELSAAVFGGDFSLSGLPLRILLVGVLVGSVQASVGTALSSTAFVNALFKLGGLTLIFSVAMNGFLIPFLGVEGAAIANSATTVVAVLLSLYITQRLIKIKLAWSWFARLSLFSVGLAGATYAAGLVISPYICVSVAIGILVLVLLKYFVPSEDLAVVHFLIKKTLRRV